MFNFKEIHIKDIMLIGNAIQLKTDYEEKSEPACLKCGGLFEKVETREEYCYGKPINGRYVKIFYPVHTYECPKCHAFQDEYIPEELGYYLTKEYYDEIVKILEEDDIDVEEISKMTGLSLDDAEMLLLNITYEQIMY